MSGVVVSRDAFFEEFLDQLDVLYCQVLESDGLSRIAEQYHRECSTIGRRVRVETPTGTFVGRAIAISKDGLLEVESAEGLRRVTVADVVHLRAVESST